MREIAQHVCCLQETEAELEKLHKDIPRIERRMTDMAAALQEAEQVCLAGVPCCYHAAEAPLLHT